MRSLKKEAVNMTSKTYKQNRIAFFSSGFILRDTEYYANFFHHELRGQNITSKTPIIATQPPTISPRSGLSPSKNHPKMNDKTMKNPPYTA
mmetsp:Transcript_25179/g.29018  ORF Transcript_25179/g.29018 Transcript_25179/m.29018 type:complete len:91 (+) Transcript_25179:186-458(+)